VTGNYPDNARVSPRVQIAVVQEREVGVRSTVSDLESESDRCHRPDLLEIGSSCRYLSAPIALTQVSNEDLLFNSSNIRGKLVSF